jgi:hypothetical protein
MKSTMWILATLLVGIVAAGSPTAWASPSEEADDPGAASRAPGGPYIMAQSPSAAGSAPMARPPGPPVSFDGRLLGTAVVEGGPSIAFLQLSTGTRFVREGDEIVAGVRLVKVWRSRIEVERGGVRQEIKPRSSELTAHEAPPGALSPRAAPADVDRLWETQGRTGRSLFYSHYRKPQN